MPSEMACGNTKTQVQTEAVKKPILFSTEESARVFLWIALADLSGIVFPFFSACGGF
jgi:hypothetical protein